MKKVKNILIIILILYSYSLFIFIPYFNYNYAVNNGFTKWLLLGEVVSTGKAIIWPYFIFSADNKNVKSRDLDIINFYKSLENSQNATKIINQGEPYKIIPEENMDKILSYYEKALMYANKVDINKLNNIYNGLGKHFKNEFIKGISLKLEADKNADIPKSIKGSKLLNEWDNWYIDNMEEINRAFRKI